MIPQNDSVITFAEQERQPGRTYRIDLERKRISGWTDGREAVKQAVYKILNTERYDYLIYSWNYGIELKDLVGQSVSYVIPELKRRIEEALTQDDRVERVDAFSFEESRGKIHATFTVHTIYGDLEARKEVKI